MSRNFKSLRLARHSNTPLVGRTRLMAHLQGALARGTQARKFPLLAVFLQSPWPWLAKYLKGILNGRYKPYPTYALNGADGIYPLSSSSGHPEVRLSIAGDWGTGTEESFRIAEQISAFHPDYTIHLGDVYYVGDAPEIDENFLGIQTTGHTPVKFPRGSVGTLTLPGNHEMYGGGAPYFTRLLPWGSPAPGQSQLASFFCLESEHWRIVGLDTGYNSAGLPILGSLPGLSSIPWIGGDGRIEPAVLDWLRSDVRPRERPKATLLLSHHQYFSAFPDEVFPRPAQQLREFFQDQEVVWLWGHEHRLAVYDVHSPDGNIRCHGRCIGHGGMPVETTPPESGRAPLLFHDGRTNYPIGNNEFAGWNGFVNLRLHGPKLSLEYRDLDGKLLFEECFHAAEEGLIRLQAER